MAQRSHLRRLSVIPLMRLTATVFSLVENSLSIATEGVCVSYRKTVSSYTALLCTLRCTLLYTCTVAAVCLQLAFQVVSDIHGHACDQSLVQRAAHHQADQWLHSSTTLRSLPVWEGSTVHQGSGHHFLTPAENEHIQAIIA